MFDKYDLKSSEIIFTTLLPSSYPTVYRFFYTLLKLIITNINYFEVMNLSVDHY